MMETGIIARAVQHYKTKTDSSDVLKAMTTYSVETEGVLFFHVKLFVYFLASAAAFAVVVLLMELLLNYFLKY